MKVLLFLLLGRILYISGPIEGFAISQIPIENLFTEGHRMDIISQAMYVWKM